MLKLIFEIDPSNEHLALEAAMHIDEYNFPIYYKLSNGTLMELPVTRVVLEDGSRCIIDSKRT